VEYIPKKKGQKSRLERELARLNTGIEVDIIETENVHFPAKKKYLIFLGRSKIFEKCQKNASTK
jgi:hypothetical protein